MKLIAVCGSPRREKYTQWALEQSLAAAREASPYLETELIPLAGKQISGCTDCSHCRGNFGCSIKDDFQPIIDKLKDPDVKGLLLGSPVYMGGMTSQLKAFLDRTVLFRRNGFAFKNLLGGALSVGGSRNGGQELVLQNIHASMMIHDMMIIGDGGGTAHFGGTGWANVPGGQESDETALATFRNLGMRMGETLNLICGGGI